MATKQINQYSAASTIDPAVDYLLIDPAGSGSYLKINRNTIMGVTGTPADLSTTQTFTNKVIGNTNTITIKDGSSLTIQNTADTTKQLRFSLSSITTGNTRTLTVPDISDTLVTLTATQTLTNKTLTSPTISAPTITNASITADAVSGFTTSNSGTIYGVGITSGQIASGSSLANGIVGSSQLATGAVGATNISTSAITLGYAQITSSFTSTTTPGYVDVTGLSVTVTVPSGGRNLKITAFCGGLKTSGSAGNLITWSILESSTVLATTVPNEPVSGYAVTAICVAYVAAPSAGSHTYKVSSAQSGAGTLTVSAGAANPSVGTYGPAYILVEAI